MHVIYRQSYRNKNRKVIYQGNFSRVFFLFFDGSKYSYNTNLLVKIR